jgi:outer membrane protein assembly factor BamB
MTRFRSVAAGLATLATVAAMVSCVTPPPPPAPVPATDDWPMLMHDVRHTGIAGTTALKASNAGQLGMRYMTNTGNWVYSSPVVATVASLGKQLVFVGNKAKFVFAFDAATGEQVWRSQTSSNNSSTPAVYEDVVYIGSSDYKMYAFSAVDGHEICSFNTGGIVQASPTVVDPDGSGIRVYFGDAGLGGAPDGGHVWSMHGVDATDAFADCSADWSYDQFGDPAGSHPEAGSWSSPSYGQLATGRRIIVIGASSTDNAAYAFDALTGARIWRFGTPAPFPDADVGAGTTFSPPGVNGFADGAAYIAGKNHHVYGLNPRTGAAYWDFDVQANAPAASNYSGRSTPALVGNVIYVGWGEGVFAIDATTGAMVWRFTSANHADVVGSPAVSGPPGDQVVFAADVAGTMFALDAQTGTVVWQYQAGDLIYGSVAVAAGNVYFAAQDGFVYSFGLGAGNSARPHATIDSPTDGATLPPGGTVPMSGVATDDVAVTKVLVGVRQDSGALWYDAAANSWQKYFVANPATMTTPDQPSTGWTFNAPVSTSGGSYTIVADAVDGNGQHVAPVTLSRFQVGNAVGAPDTVINVPVHKQVYNLAAVPVPVPITVSGTATDTAGPHPGVAQVKLVVLNLQHTEYWCGAPGCAVPGNPAQWTTVYSTVNVPLGTPGGRSTGFSITLPSYDHPHDYRVTAWAIDNDGNPDPFKANVSRICVRLPGDNTCN